jgi:hypothetical protein
MFQVKYYTRQGSLILEWFFGELVDDVATDEAITDDWGTSDTFDITVRAGAWTADLSETKFSKN